eukprot:SAG31_NODE_1287_length_8999_cov_3.844382_9_plen_121_part_00
MPWATVVHTVGYDAMLVNEVIQPPQPSPKLIRAGFPLGARKREDKCRLFPHITIINQQEDFKISADGMFVISALWTASRFLQYPISARVDAHFEASLAVQPDSFEQKEFARWVRMRQDRP